VQIDRNALEKESLNVLLEIFYHSAEKSKAKLLLPALIPGCYY